MQKNHPNWSHTLGIWLLLILALGLNLTMIKSIIWAPDFLALALCFLHNRIRIANALLAAFLIGLGMDIINGAVLGNQSLAYVLMMYTILRARTHIQWYNYFGQAFFLYFILIIPPLTIALLNFLINNEWYLWTIVLQPLSGALLWPILRSLLDTNWRQKSKKP